MFIFNYSKLESLGYLVVQDTKLGELRIEAGEHAFSILEDTTHKAIFSDVENNTTLTCAQAENAVQAFILELQNDHIWNIATKGNI